MLGSELHVEIAQPRVCAWLLVHFGFNEQSGEETLEILPGDQLGVTYMYLPVH